MDPGLVGGVAATVALAVAAASISILRRVLAARRLRIRLELQPAARHAGAGAGILRLADPFEPPDFSFRAGGSGSSSRPLVAQEIPPPRFWTADRRPWRMAPALFASLAMHAALAAVLPEAMVWLSRALDREAILVVRVDGAIRMPLTVHAPDMRKLMFARETVPAAGAPGKKKTAPAAPPMRRAVLKEPAIPPRRERPQDLPAPPIPSAAAAISAPRPERPYRVVPATTLLQPRRPMVQREVVELPAFAAWAGRMPDIPLVQAPGSPLAGMARAAAPPRAPVLPLRSGAPVRAEPPRLEEPKLALPPPGIPAEAPPPSGALSGNGIPQPGEPVSVLSISPVPLRPGETVNIPPVNQVGGGLDAAGRSGSGAHAVSPTAQAAELASTSRAETSGSVSHAGAEAGVSGREGAPGEMSAARGGSSRAGSAGLVRGMETAAGSGTGGTASSATGGREAGPGSGSRAGGAGAAGSGSGTAPGSAPGATGRGQSGLVPVRLGTQVVMMERRPEGAVVLHYPPDGNFDVIVVESALPDPLDGLAKRLSGRPVYTAYLNVGAGREWMLHFCAAGKQQQTATQSMVVTLEDPPPLRPPYVLRAELPAPEEWKSSRYQVFHGYITGQGKMERISAVLASRNPAGLLKLLPYWEFRAASRGGSPVEVEVLLVVPPERAP